MIIGVTYMAVYYRENDKFVSGIPFVRLLDNSFEKAISLYVKIGDEYRPCILSGTDSLPLYDTDGNKIYDSDGNPIYVQTNKV